MSSTSASPTSRSPSFFKTELERALREESFGIAGYSIGPASTFDASATVTLLEGVRIVIALTVRGYKVTNGSVPAAANTGAEFETLEVLLQHYSPLYTAKRAELLISRLSP